MWFEFARRCLGWGCIHFQATKQLCVCLMDEALERLEQSDSETVMCVFDLRGFGCVKPPQPVRRLPLRLFCTLTVSRLASNGMARRSIDSSQIHQATRREQWFWRLPDYVGSECLLLPLNMRARLLKWSFARTSLLETYLKNSGRVLASIRVGNFGCPTPLSCCACLVVLQESLELQLCSCYVSYFLKYFLKLSLQAIGFCVQS